MPIFRLEPEIVGTVEATYKFQNLCDFQYLPVERVKEEEAGGGAPVYRSIYEDVYCADRLREASWLEDKVRDDDDSSFT